MYSQRIKEIRQNLDLSVSKLSKKIEIAARTIVSYESEGRTPSLEFLAQLCKNFNINPLWFMFGSGQMFINKCENTHTLIKNDKPAINAKNWGKRLAELLAETEETPLNFSRRTGIKESRIEKFILDSAEPTFAEMCAIKSNVDISFDELFFGETYESEVRNSFNAKNTKSAANKSPEITLTPEEILKLKKLISTNNID